MRRGPHTRQPVGRVGRNSRLLIERSLDGSSRLERAARSVDPHGQPGVRRRGCVCVPEAPATAEPAARTGSTFPRPRPWPHPRGIFGLEWLAGPLYLEADAEETPTSDPELDPERTDRLREAIRRLRGPRARQVVIHPAWSSEAAKGSRPNVSLRERHRWRGRYRRRRHARGFRQQGDSSSGNLQAGR